MACACASAPVDHAHKRARNAAQVAARTRIAWLGLIAALLALLHLFADTLRWLWHVPFSGDDRRLNVALLLVFGVLLTQRLRRLRAQSGPLFSWPDRLSDPSRLAALALFLGPLLACVLLRHLVGESTLSAACFLLSVYGGLGLFLAPPHFRAGLSGMLLLIASLPFAALADGYMGLLARIFTAEIVQQLLSALHIAALPVSSILILERGIAHIDIPCSGLRGLWSGVLAYLLISWISRRQLGLVWLVGLLLMQALLLLANIGRVFLLVVLAHVASLPDLAEHLHMPLGLFGFALCVAFAFFYLRQVVVVRLSGPATDETRHPARMPQAADPTAKHGMWLVPALALVLFVLCASDARSHRRIDSAAAIPLDLPANLHHTPQPLTVAEREVFARFGAHAQKFRIPGGSLIVVQANTLPAFRAHHPPEVCLLAAGLRIVTASSVEVAPGAQARLLTLQDRPPSHASDVSTSDPLRQRSGIYWFQSAESTTPDIVRRILRQLISRRPWLLVTMVSDDHPDPRPLLDATPSQHQTAFLAMARSIHTSLAHSLRATPKPGDHP